MADLSRQEIEILDSAMKQYGRYLYGRDPNGADKKEICYSLVLKGYANHIPGHSSMAPGITLTTKGINYASERL